MNTSTFTWKDELRSMITDPVTLIKMLEIDQDMIPLAQRVASHFPLRTTASFVSRIRKKDPQDPLLKQILPLSQEEEIAEGFVKDPLEEKQHNPVPGLLHKYHGRVLLTLTGGCAIHCRYCFRRHFPYMENVPGRKLDKILDYIQKDTSIFEVILSGGDPFMVSDRYLADVMMQLATITHLKVVRFHPRLPVVLPRRITRDLIKVLTNTHLKVICVIHCNHPQEIDEKVVQGLAQLSQANIILLNQSVLLKGINDTTETLKSLSERLFDCKVMPYYLHKLDKVEGSAHFEVNILRAKKLYYSLRAQLPGYLVPLLVEERPGQPSKLPIV